MLLDCVALSGGFWCQYAFAWYSIQHRICHWTNRKI